MRRPLLSGAACGAASGLLTAIVAALWLDPVLARAIALEGAADGPVSRTTQRVIGLPLGMLLTGAALGLLYGLVARGLPAERSPWERATGLALAGFTALALVPALRYPADPPGVGDPDTVSSRTGGYLLAVLLGVLVVSGGWLLLRRLRARGLPPHTRQPAVLLIALVVLAVGYAALPDASSAGDVPADLMWTFRLRSLAVLALLWAGLGALYGLVWTRDASRTGVLVR